MGAANTKPYIIDEFDSDDDDEDGYQSALESVAEPTSLSPVSLPPSVQSEESSEVTSTWPSTTHEEITENLSCIVQQEQNANAVDYPCDNEEDHRRALALLDEELLQFEANGQKVSHETPVQHSGIPRLKSGSLRSGRSLGFGSNLNTKPVVERKRSPSPHGSRPSGIPRYSYAHVMPVGSGAPGEVGSDVQTIETSSLSNTLECLPELTDRKQTSTNKTKPTRQQHDSCNGNHCPGTVETTGDPSLWDTSVSSLTGRAKTIKKHSCLPSLWVRTEGQKFMRSSNSNPSQPSSSTSSDVPISEKDACRVIGEWGGLSERKILDIRRWYCISRPQYKTSCGISAVVSCWNYLFSTMGHGSLPPVTQETAMKLLGFTSPFDGINFGLVTGNLTVMRWFRELNTHFNVNGQCSVMYKPSGKSQTVGVTDQIALDLLRAGLKDSSSAFIYHCHNHYFCPIGYEDTSQFCVDAYKGDIGKNGDSWVIFGDTSRKHSPIQCQSWERICLDLNSKSPSYYNIRESWKGIMQRKNISTVGENLHCIMIFQKVSEQLQPSPSSLASSSTTSSSFSIVTSSRLPFRPNGSAVSPNRPSALRSTVDTPRPELGDHFTANLEEEEVGCENLDSDFSEDDVKQFDGRETDDSQVNKREENESEVNKREENESEVEKHEVNESEVNKHEVNESEVNKREVNESEVNKHEVNESEVNKRGENESEVNKHEVNESEVSEHEVNKNDVNEHDVNESEVNKREVDEIESNDREVNKNEVNEHEVNEIEVYKHEINEHEVTEADGKSNESEENESEVNKSDTNNSDSE